MGNLNSCDKNQEPFDLSETKKASTKPTSHGHEPNDLYPKKLPINPPQSRKPQDNAQATSIKSQEEPSSSFEIPAPKETASLDHLYMKIKFSRTIIPRSKLVHSKKCRAQHRMINFDAFTNHKNQDVFAMEIHQIFNHPQKNSNRNLQEMMNIVHSSSKTCTNLTLIVPMFSSSQLIPPFPKLQYLPTLNRLDLHFYGHKDLNPSIIRVLSHSISSLKHLANLTFRFFDFRTISEKTFSKLFLPLKRLRSLSHVSIYLDYNGSFTATHLQNLAAIICKLPQIKTLVLDFHKTSSLVPESLRHISRIFQKIPSLSGVSLQFNSFPLCASAMGNLFSGLKTLESLAKFEFSCGEIDPIYVSLGLGTLNVGSLREVSLKLQSRFNDYSLIDLSQNLQKFSLLKSLTLDLANLSYVNKKGISQLAACLKSLTGLLKLNLSFSGDYLCTLDSISQSLGCLTQLTDLFLNISNSKAQNFSIKALSVSLQKLKGLKSFTLLSSRYNVVTDNTVGYLMQGLKELGGSLRNLVLDLSYNKALTNKGVEILAGSLKYLPGLTDLTLDFYEVKIDGLALKSIAQGLKNLNELYSFDLTFYNTGDWKEDKSGDLLLDTFRSLTGLREITLRLGQVYISPGKMQSLKHSKNIK